ncbi:MAG TPA: hypothetical protein VGA80_05210 [Flavobacteriaceae bacterium]
MDKNYRETIKILYDVYETSMVYVTHPINDYNAISNGQVKS